mgnify:CR=1 FL=1
MSRIGNQHNNVGCGLVDEEMELPLHNAKDITQEDVHEGVDNHDIGVPHQVEKSVPSNAIIDGILGGKSPSSPDDWLIEQPRVITHRTWSKVTVHVTTMPHST